MGSFDLGAWSSEFQPVETFWVGGVGWLVGWLGGGWLGGGVGVRCDGWVFLVFLRRAMGWGEDSVLCSVGDGAVIFFEG